MILMLGRFEAFGYKNSPAVFEVFRHILTRVKDAHLLLLVGPDSIAIPDDLRGRVTTLPTISDHALLALMQCASLGLSLSLWEGFNLPIAEMQWLGRPTLAFNIGAHPEIVADPWLLCETRNEMARKAVEILTSDGSLTERLEAGYAAFRKRFVWSRTLTQWTQEILEPEQNAHSARSSRRSRLVLMDVSNSARDPGNSGVIRVTRRLGKELSQRTDLDVVFVIWDAARKTYTLPPGQATFLSSNGGPVDWLGTVSARNDDQRIIEKIARSGDPASGLSPVLMLPEVILDGTAQARVAWARRHNCMAASVFYDMLPIYSRELVAKSVRDAFPNYVRAISTCDAAWAISGFSQSEFERYADEKGLDKPRQREAVWLPGQFSDNNRRTQTHQRSDDIHVLMISTLEPRKNHTVLLEAFKMVRQRRPEMPMYLHLVGNSYVDAKEILRAVQRATREDDHIQYHGAVSDDVVAKLYDQASFTVYPSQVEGFGLPILESLWMGCPCVCGKTGVMAELAEGGGCLTVDVSNPYELAAAIERIATDSEMHGILTRQAHRRKIDTWSSYAKKIAGRLHEL